ncbi:MAG: 50S ribosomal protein L11 methyltransferase [Caldilineaceae bacterium]|nr:50S ribosomal protein L11 methyltransferase [Caldilineaceae bacterium]
MAYGEILEISVECDSEAAEAVSELFNRYNGGDYDDDSAAGEASGGGAVIEAVGFDDFGRPLPGEYRLWVKTYIKPGPRGDQIRRQIEEGLWRLSLLYPIPEPQLRTLRDEDWAHAWKRFYKPLRVGRRVVLKPSWEEFASLPDDLVIELDPGMAFGTGLHPSTRLCIAALEELVQPGDTVLDLGTGSGVLAIVACKLGAAHVFATDIDPLAVEIARENAERNGIPTEADGQMVVEPGSVPAGMAGRYSIIVANILAEVLAKLFDAEYGYPPLAEPLAPAGHIILSGIIEERAGLVLDAAQRHRFRLVDRKQEGDWVALVVSRQG